MNSTTTYTCAMCQRSYETGWTNTEAEAEYSVNFPLSKAHNEPTAVVCDECYRLMLDLIAPEDVEKEYFDERN